MDQLKKDLENVECEITVEQCASIVENLQKRFDACIKC